MTKWLILLSVLTLALGCGKSSTIKPAVNAQTICDGQHCVQSIFLPLTEVAIAPYQSNLRDIGPLLRGLVGSVMNLGANMGAGKKRMTLIQPIPMLPDYMSSLKVKRIFFFIEAKNNKQNFEFLRRLALKISSSKIEEKIETWAPIMKSADWSGTDTKFFDRIYKKVSKNISDATKSRETLAEDWKKESPGMLMLAYDQGHKEKSLRGKTIGTIHIINTKNPNLTKKYIESEYKDSVERVHTLSKTVLVQLKNDRVADELFKQQLSRDSYKLQELEVGEIKPCNSNVCLDVKVEDVNLLPILNQGNAIQIDAYIDPKEVPDDFQLKGFLEFELKIKSVI